MLWDMEKLGKDSSSASTALTRPVIQRRPAWSLNTFPVYFEQFDAKLTDATWKMHACSSKIAHRSRQQVTDSSIVICSVHIVQ